MKCLILHHVSLIPLVKHMSLVRSSIQFTPAIRPCLQTLAIGLVAFGENYKRHQSGIG